MTSYFLAFSWGIFILLSFIGWGALLNHILFPKERVDWGLRASWGLACTICVGGFLNFASLISRTIIIIYLGFGFLYFLLDFDRNKIQFIGKINQLKKAKNDKIFILCAGIVFFLFILNYAGWIYSSGFPTFKLTDDYQAYFVFPHKMLQIGSLGIDPFSQRKLETSLGGQSFLHALILTALSEAHLNIIDPGIALIIVAGILFAYLHKQSIAKEKAIFIIFFLLILPHYKANTSSAVTTTVLFLSLFITFDWERLKLTKYLPNACIVALITSAICSLKSSVIPACVIFFLLSYFFYWLTSKNNRLTVVFEFLLSVILVILFLLPWMISMYRSSGTHLYPLLGKGYHWSVYMHENSEPSKLAVTEIFKIFSLVLTQPYFVCLVVLGAISFILKPHKIKGRAASLSLSISALLGALLIALAVGEGPGEARLSVPFANAAIIILLVNALAEKQNSNTIWRKFLAYNHQFIAIFLMVTIAIQLPHDTRQFLGKDVFQMVVDIKKGLKNEPLISDRENRDYRAMQESIPEGKTILARLDLPFLLDFKRNNIFIIDWPGGASLPPGMPLFQGSEALADYLLSKSIQYVAYSYASEATISTKKDFWRQALEPETRPRLRGCLKS